MHSLRLDGFEKELWEPLWQLGTRLSLLEQALLSTSPVRRLHHLTHNGSSSILSGYTQSRLQHTLGVFALIAYFQPKNKLLRVAALLHDVGHYPFSHTLERLPGIDHHQLTLEKIQAAPIAPLLREHDIEIVSLVKLIEGDVATILRNKKGIMHTDHLDSWVRSGQARGQLKSAPELLKNLNLVGNHLETDLATAERLSEFIVSEAHFHASAANLGSSAVLEKLVSLLLDAKLISTKSLAEMTDAELSFQLLNSPQTSLEARKLWFGPEHLALAREPIAGVEGMRVIKDKFCLSLPQVQGKPADSAKTRELLASVEKLRGDYFVYWSSE